ncbi:hypothetical protein [Brucella pseudintermedia]|uniref:hypothetical protein n=1 Tax=Brucella pseudintermedia TaxID=370111 RepID=UPI0030F45F12
MTIPEQAVQAAANAAHEELLSMAKQMNVPMEYTQSISVNNYRVMRAALTAAAPHLAAVRVNIDESALHTLWTMGNCRLPFEQFKARVIAALEPAATCNESLQVEPAAPEAQLAAFLNDLSGENGELIDRMAAAIRDWGSHYDDGPWETLPEDRKAGWRGDAERALEVVKEYLTTRALSSPDHADAGKVEGDGWLPIESAPKDGTVIQAWHQVHKCPVSVLWKDDGFPYRGERLNWHERTYTTAWPERAFTHWRPLPSAPASEGAE